MDNITTVEKVTKVVEEVDSLGQSSIHAMLKSGEILNKGFQTISKIMATGAQSQIDLNLSTCKAMSDVKSVKDAIALQSAHARKSFEAFFGEAGKLSKASVKLAEEAMAPIKGQMALAAEQFAHSFA